MAQSAGQKAAFLKMLAAKKGKTNPMKGKAGKTIMAAKGAAKGSFGAAKAAGKIKKKAY